MPCSWSKATFGAPSWNWKPKSSKPSTVAMSTKGIQMPSLSLRFVKQWGSRS